jgi:hypothetical protein
MVALDAGEFDGVQRLAHGADLVELDQDELATSFSMPPAKEKCVQMIDFQLCRG